MGVGDVDRGRQVAVEGLRLGEGPGSSARVRLRMALGDIGQDRGGLGQHALVGDQRRHPALGIDRQVLGLALVEGRTSIRTAS
jgi:hypothetical protein